MAAKIKQTFPGAEVDLIKGSRGAYVVIVDGKLVWHKKEMGDEFPNENRLVASLKGDTS